MIHPHANEFLETAIQAASDAVAHQRDLFSTVSASYKSPRDIVTRADVESERLIREHIADRHPDHGIVGEEQGTTGDRQARWIVDPIDGTTNFYHGIPHYAVSIGLELDGERRIGLVHHVPTDDVYAAVRGRGTYCNGQQLVVSGESEIERSLVCTGFAPGAAISDASLDLLSTVVERTHGIRRFGTAATSLAFLASGLLEGYYHADLHTWDIAAGTLLVEEADGSVTTFDSSAGDRIHVVASNGGIHETLVELVGPSLERSTSEGG